ncbi:SAF domain-containing protein [Aeromicrobium sp. Sec7.5]|uniref:SAF domain-containing protein n=1 Tax=Aeromicrobium sp. Sec7.5 TaxID=3121276 RepID=UPI002FE45967
MSTRTPAPPPPSAREGALSGRRIDDRRMRTLPRRRGLLAFAGLMIAGSALAGAVLFSQFGDRTDVLAVKEDVAKGQVITEKDLERQSVAGVDGAVPVSAIDTVIGKTAQVDMVSGQIVTDSMVTSDPVPGDGSATVGLSLDAARAPSAGLSAGDLVSVVAVPSGTVDLSPSTALDAPQILAREAEVLEVQGSATEGATVLVTVVVDEDDATTIAAYSAAGLVAVVETAAAGN